MADEGRVYLESKQVVDSIHEKLRKEMHKIVEKKSWNAEQREDFEKKLSQLYQDSVEDTIKANVTIGGQEWNSVTQVDVSSTSVVREEMEPINKDRVAQVFAMCSELEDLLKDTTSKRKKYPQQITERLRIILECRKEMLENYQSLPKSDSSLSSLNLLTSEFEECIQRLESACQEISQLSKSFHDLPDKAIRLQQVVQSHNAMQKSETDAILFGRDNNINTPDMSKTSTSELSSEQPLESENSKDIVWWAQSNQKSQPAQRCFATQNAHCT